MILLLRTDNPQAEIYIIDKSREMAHIKWHAHRQLADTLHKQIATALQQAGILMDGIDGIGVFCGPGSFTGLRIGVSVANALGWSLKKPIIALDEDQWRQAVQDGEIDISAAQLFVVPEYGSTAHTTQPKK
jgi:tRNA threonylcarbamoyladenosine biosynthesis protein TsaB